MRAIVAASLFSLFLLLATPVFGVGPGDLVPCNGPDCGTCELMQLGSNLLKFLVQASILIAGLTFAWGGFKMVISAGESGSISEAKSMMTNAVVGIVIVLSAWLLVDTLLKLVVDNATLGVWNSIQCSSQVDPSDPNYVSSQTGVQAEGELSHEEARIFLEETGRNINVTSTSGEGGVKAQCASGSGCTSLEGLRKDTVEQVIKIAEACPNCQINVVGATEAGHESGTQSHSTGYKIDIDDTAPVNQFFLTKLQRAGSRGTDLRYEDNCGNEYVRESDHWDISVTKGACTI